MWFLLNFRGNVVGSVELAGSGRHQEQCTKEVEEMAVKNVVFLWKQGKKKWVKKKQPVMAGFYVRVCIF